MTTSRIYCLVKRQSSQLSFCFGRLVLLSGLAAGGEYFRAHISAGLGPFVGMLGQHCADQSDDRVSARKDADDVGSPADLLVQSPFVRHSVRASGSVARLLLVRVAAGVR
jgi:hypothetical protein